MASWVGPRKAKPRLEIYPDFAEKAWNEYRMFNIPDELIRRSLDGLRKAGLDVPNDPE